LALKLRRQPELQNSPTTSAAVNVLPMSSSNMPADVFILRIAGEHYVLLIR
jgi:hypothetical protein